MHPLGGQSPLRVGVSSHPLQRLNTGPLSQMPMVRNFVLDIYRIAVPELFASTL